MYYGKDQAFFCQKFVFRNAIVGSKLSTRHSGRTIILIVWTVDKNKMYVKKIEKETAIRYTAPVVKHSIFKLNVAKKN